MAKVSVTIRKGRKTIQTGTLDFSKVVDRLIDLTMGATAPITARAQLNAGNTYKYKDAEFNVTLTPILNEEY